MVKSLSALSCNNIGHADAGLIRSPIATFWCNATQACPEIEQLASLRKVSFERALTLRPEGMRSNPSCACSPSPIRNSASRSLFQQDRTMDNRITILVGVLEGLLAEDGGEQTGRRQPSACTLGTTPPPFLPDSMSTWHQGYAV